MAQPHDHYFSKDYFSAREKFLALASKRGLPVQSFLHPASAQTGKEYGIDVAVAGDREAPKLFIINSGTHGLEGLAGSAIQLGIIDQIEELLPADTALCIIHGLNPWGMVHARRQNEDNIDLNRNFLNFSENTPSNLYYDLLHDKLCVPNLYIDGIPNPAVPKRIARFMAAHGEQAYHVALFQGQYTHSDGIGFGGWRPSWSHRKFYKILKQFRCNADLVCAVDIHTGLGTYGEEIIINNSAQNSVALGHAKQIYGTSLVSISKEGALPYRTKGDTFYAFEQAFPDALVIPVALEFGTFPVDDLMRLQIEDNWLHHHGDISSPVGRKIKSDLKQFFYPDDQDWRRSIFTRGMAQIKTTLTFLRNYHGVG